MVSLFQSHSKSATEQQDSREPRSVLHQPSSGEDSRAGITELVSSVGHSCEKPVDLLSEYMNYKVNGLCPDDWSLGQKLILPRRSGGIRTGFDLGGGSGTFAARMADRNVTIVTATLNTDAPFSEFIAARGLFPLYLSMDRRFPFYNNVFDLVHCGSGLDVGGRLEKLEFLMFDINRILCAGGLFWSEEVGVPKLYLRERKPIFALGAMTQLVSSMLICVAIVGIHLGSDTGIVVLLPKHQFSIVVDKDAILHVDLHAFVQSSSEYQLIDVEQDPVIALQSGIKGGLWTNLDDIGNRGWVYAFMVGIESELVKGFLELWRKVLFYIDKLVFGGALDEGVEVHLHNGVFVYDDGELVFGEVDDDAPVAAEVNTGNGCAAEHRTEVVYNRSEQRDLPLGHHPFLKFQRLVTQLKGNPR
ncbi:hypothetical protein Vadar_022090 [Vaccinium darrowii]|uniref:Uncharacterized protein n=1 Tax=Vaccinium darrowii TaxID=229202 RepID=A0ACB7Y8I0_9ERIC|nr:hypothetical protein Vadar_022090 [Vaccinium darrowii]